MHYQSIDRGVHWESGYLQETIDRWHQEGLPKEITVGEGPGSVEVEVDFAAGWEDICFRGGPLISPQMFSSTRSANPSEAAPMSSTI